MLFLFNVQLRNKYDDDDDDMYTDAIFHQQMSPASSHNDLQHHHHPQHQQQQSDTSSLYVRLSYHHSPLSLFLLHCALSLAAQCIVVGPVCGFVCLWVGVFVCLWVYYHDNSKLRASILTTSPNWVCR